MIHKERSPLDHLQQLPKSLFPTALPQNAQRLNDERYVAIANSLLIFQQTPEYPLIL